MTPTTSTFATLGRLQPLPIDPLLPEIVQSLARTPTLVLEAPPGAGKTTRVPRALLDARGREAGEIVVVEPRRLAARMAARRVAEELGEEVGGTVGYTVRFENVASAKTRIRFVTEGVLTRRLLGAEPGASLDGVQAVVLDEFHERHLETDLALTLVRRLQGRGRHDLGLVVMSATLASAPIATFLDAPTIRSEGRLHDVAVEHLAGADDRPLHQQVASAVRSLASTLDGDVLVFLPGAAEIRRALEACGKLAEEHRLLLVPLHGDLSPAEQDRAVRRADRRKVILSTNVAESSVTIDGVVAVVDSGLARVMRHAHWSGLPALRVEKTSRSSAVQRAGRAGRTRPGRCLRLYTKHDFDTRPEHDPPEIRRADLAQTLLELRTAGVGDLAWFEAPPDASWRAAETLLARLGALDARGGATDAGRRMARFGVHPRQARLLVEAERRGVGDEGSVVAALVGERDIRLRARTRFGDARAHAAATERSDLLAMMDAFREAKESRFSAQALRAAELDGGATLAVERARSSFRLPRSVPASPAEAETALLQCVLAAYPDRVARRGSGKRLALAGGGVAELSEASAVRDAPWLVAVDAEERPGGGVLVRVASAIEPDWLIDLFPESVEERTDITWNAKAERVDAYDRILYEGLVLDESPSTRATDDMIARSLTEAALAAGPRSFAADGALDRWLVRVRTAASVRPDLVPPTEDDVVKALGDLCAGARSFADLRAAGLLERLKGRFGAGKCREVERLTPDRISLLGGRSMPVMYEDGKPPWAESYLQDFFGMQETPRIADGRIPIVLHLLAPNRRAVQVTGDLAGFWSRHYPTVRKELMRKYPKHSWPEDPTKPAPRYTRR